MAHQAAPETTARDDLCRNCQPTNHSVWCQGQGVQARVVNAGAGNQTDPGGQQPTVAQQDAASALRLTHLAVNGDGCSKTGLHQVAQSCNDVGDPSVLGLSGLRRVRHGVGIESHADDGREALLGGTIEAHPSQVDGASATA